MLSRFYFLQLILEHFRLAAETSLWLVTWSFTGILYKHVDVVSMIVYIFLVITQQEAAPSAHSWRETSSSADLK